MTVAVNVRRPEDDRSDDDPQPSSADGALGATEIRGLVDLDPERPIGVFEYARLKLYLGELLGGAGDIVNRKTVKPLLRESILRDCVNAF
jgi:hypothetical protein